MITNTGKSIIGKFLVDQKTTYASHIAIGCGAKPLKTTDTFADYSSKTSLDFEMERIPITSSGLITEDGITKIAFSGQLPTTNRYDITEIGIFSAESNPIAQGFDSRGIYDFGSTENWEFHSSSGSNLLPSPNTISSEGVVTVDLPAFILSAGDALFNDAPRQAALERPRFMDKTVVVRGNTSTITPNATTGEFDISGISGDTTGHIHFTGQGQRLNFDNNTANDELVLSFSVITADYGVGVPDEAYVVIEFTSAESSIQNNDYAKLQVKIESADFAEGSYFTKTVKLGGDKTGSYYTDSLYKTENFSWSKVSTVKVYCSVVNNSAISSGHYIALDGLRFENKTSLQANPIYGMVAYSVIKNDVPNSSPLLPYPIEKDTNSNSLIEFKFALDIGVTP